MVNIVTGEPERDAREKRKEKDICLRRVILICIHQNSLMFATEPTFPSIIKPQNITAATTHSEESPKHPIAHSHTSFGTLELG